MLFKNFDKNGTVLKHGINYKDPNGNNVLCYLLTNNYVAKSMLPLLFEICNKCKTNFTKETIEKALNYVDHIVKNDNEYNRAKKQEFENGNYKSIIENEYNKLEKILHP